MKEKISKEELFILLQSYKQELDSTKKWEQFRNSNPSLKLPHYQTIIRKFGKWNTLKEMLGLTQNDSNRPIVYQEEELFQILKKHKKHFTSQQAWNEYAKEQHLPSYQLFWERLGREKMDKFLPNLRRHYDKDSLKELMLQNYPKKPPIVREWTDFAKSSKEHLPSYQTYIRAYGSWQNAMYHIYGHNLKQD